MRRLVVIVEGDSEKEFVQKVLTPYLNSKGIFAISCYKISKTNGGLTNYQHLRKDIVRAWNEVDTFVTTLVDFYALPEDFPQFEDSRMMLNKAERVSFLERAIVEDICRSPSHPRLLPYIQLHEFEAYAFVASDGFRACFSEREADFKGLKKVVDDFENPEEINENKETAPSKRLKKLIPGYSKVVDGIRIIRANGLDRVIEKCPRFRWWVGEIVAGATIEGQGDGPIDLAQT